MSRILTVHYNEKPIYNIVIDNSFEKLSNYINQLNIENRRICIITDSNVAPIYLKTVTQEITKTGNAVYSCVIPAGETNKNLKTIETIYEFLIQNKFDRKDYLVALGGGVVGDMTGYAAATYLRGINFIQIPTTLLAQVDSSIGGKTGVDFNCYKNMVGAFHQPSLVFINTATLTTLSKRLFNSGLGEIIKHGFIKDSDYYRWLIDNVTEISNLNPEIIEEMIYVSCNIKRLVVEKDPTEQGERALLNFGHTLGHAIENLCNFQLYHGECVILGCICAINLCVMRGFLSKEDLNEAISLFERFNFPTKVSGMTSEDILRISKNDKKMDANKIKFILLECIGNGFIDKTVSDEEILEATKIVLI